MTKPFRFAIQSGMGEALHDPKVWADNARMVEDLGFSVLLVPDHYMPMLSPMPALMAAAAVTTRLRVGTLVLNQEWRHPAVLAKEAATVDFLSNGRLELGLGIGSRPREPALFGLPVEEPGVRIQRFKEYVAVVRGLLENTTFTFHGKYYQVFDVEGQPPAVQKPGPPILIGGHHPRMLAVAAQLASIVGLAGGRLEPGDDRWEAMSQRIRWVREAAGPRVTSLELSLNCTGPVPIGVRRSDAAHVVANTPGLTGSRVVTEEDAFASLTMIMGTEKEVVERLLEVRERLGVSYFSYMPRSDTYRESAKAFAPIVARLSGT